MRKFYFENKAGFENFSTISATHTYADCVAENLRRNNRIRLNYEDGVFLYTPSGLGMEFNHTYGEIGGDGFFRRNKFSTAQLGPSFTLFFNPNSSAGPYKEYRKLLDWIARAKELYLVYSPNDDITEEYYRHIHIKTMEKTELDRNHGSLMVPVTVLPITPWFLPNPMVIDFINASDYNKKYKANYPSGQQNPLFGYVYDNNLRYGYASNYPCAEFAANGHINAAVKVTLTGPVTNPEIVLFGIDSRQVYGDCKINTSISSGESIVLSTLDQDSYVIKRTSLGQEIDLIDSLDITKNAFFKVPIEESCVLQLQVPDYTGSASMTLYQFYRGV